MRLAVVTAAFHAHADDPFVPVWRDMVRALAARADVTVYPLRLPASGPPYDLDGARVVPLGHGMVRLRRSPAMWRRAIGAVAADHACRPFDAALALQSGEAGFVAALAVARIGRPLQVHVAGGEVVCDRSFAYGSQCHPIERIQVAIALRRAAVITTGCAAMVAGARRHLPARQSDRVCLAPLGIDPRPWTALRPALWRGEVGGDRHAEGGLEAPAEPRLLAVADFRPIKDHALLVRAFAEVVAATPARLDLVGAGATLGATLQLGQRLGVADRIRCWGWVPPLVRHVPFVPAHAFVHASRHEAQGMALIEAALLGLPIASTRVGVAESLPVGGRFVTDVGDGPGLVAAIHRALERAAEPLAARDERRAQAAAAYDRDVCAARWLALLEGAIRVRTANGRRGRRQREACIDVGADAHRDEVDA